MGITPARVGPAVAAAGLPVPSEPCLGHADLQLPAGRLIVFAPPVPGAALLQQLSALPGVRRCQLRHPSSLAEAPSPPA